MKKFVISSVMFLASSSMALASGSDVWSGTGQMFDAARVPVSSYSLTVTNDAVAANADHLVVEVRAGGNVVYSSDCDVTKEPNRWHKLCKDGAEGWGYVFDHGLAQEYQNAGNGKVFITQIIVDTPTTKRLLRTELQDNQVVHYFSETLEKTGK